MRYFYFFIFTLLLVLPVASSAQESITIKDLPPERCNLVINSLKENLENANFCQQDSDCIIMHLGCPLPCDAPMNKDVNLQHFVALKQAYDVLCKPTCTTSCTKPSRGAKCVERKCVY